jgi:hypothetical protein
MHRWIDRPVLFVFPLIGVLASRLLIWSVSRRRELLPFLAGLAIFAAAMGTLAVSFYPYMIPFSITVADAAAPYSSQVFLFWGAGLVALPLTLIYTLVVYFVFKGKTAVEPLSYWRPGRKHQGRRGNANRDRSHHQYDSCRQRKCFGDSRGGPFGNLQGSEHSAEGISAGDHRNDTGESQSDRRRAKVTGKALGEEPDDQCTDQSAGYQVKPKVEQQSPKRVAGDAAGPGHPCRNVEQQRITARRECREQCILWNADGKRRKSTGTPMP